MAYSRFSRYCRVYMYLSVVGGFQFHISGDVVDGKTDFLIRDPHEALRRLKRLNAQGKFGKLDGAIERLEAEIAAGEHDWMLTADWSAEDRR
jgi:hypothetical protein